MNSTRQAYQNAPSMSERSASRTPYAAQAPPSSSTVTHAARRWRTTYDAWPRATADRYTSPWPGGTNAGTLSKR
jgi:hypothetical protein